MSATDRRFSWRKQLREAHGPRVWQILLAIAEGHAWIPRLPDGREGPPQIPSTSDRLTAAVRLAEALYGRSPDAGAVAEQEANSEQLRALSDADLEARVRALLDQRARTAGTLPAPVDAEIAVK